MYTYRHQVRYHHRFLIIISAKYTAIGLRNSRQSSSAQALCCKHCISSLIYFLYELLSLCVFLAIVTSCITTHTFRWKFRETLNKELVNTTSYCSLAIITPKKKLVAIIKTFSDYLIFSAIAFSMPSTASISLNVKLVCSL